MKTFYISEQTIQQVLNYLVQHPYKEVKGLIESIIKEVNSQSKDEKQENKKE